jgi:ribosomal protein L37AE/L43A
MMDKRKSEEYVELTCPSCGRKSRIPQTAGAPSRCEYCGKDWYTSKIEVQSEESRRLRTELERARKNEIEADKDRE